MEIRLDKNSLSLAQRAVAECSDGFPKALSRAINKTTATTKTYMVALIRERYNFKAAAVRRRFAIIKSTYSKLSGGVKSEGRRVLLTDVTGTRQTAKGVSVNVKKSTGVKLIPSAFIAPGRNIATGELMSTKLVYRRKMDGDKMVPRLPIEGRYATWPEVVYNTNDNFAKIKQNAQEKLDANLAHELDVIIKGIA